ncbi:RNA helicase [Vibrio parahaemolyticus]|uniref:RNA helicase n=1 Tax=Vibrio parahaemolyticus TaxID=670 RepID=UPI000EFBF737|nr:RNA helicase [Vibrio parahaemolyticus]AYO04060.1 RNA helicase [Vibrio parahaemolyticus]MBE4076193.1 RNA helicase [Vibrio parahaemolyticus]MBE4272639.1 RNA helicase [Vibrio parahaemolyticus]MBE4277472.1 RNA helicase [Vibrio parahaemolyticus]MCZ6289670.1 RNA helicase [Vibrio parahaemolyticus]
MEQEKTELKCGLIMPISPIDGCSAEHWSEVKDIIEEALVGTDFHVKLVSDASDVGIIQKRIVQNIYDNEIVICDVSGKNPNVMFELGMRLAFDKPTIIIKDDKTNYSFDTSPIEHIEYPRDLHYSTIKAFKETLKHKVIATYQASQDPAYTTFLKHFGEFKVAAIASKEVTKEDFILESISELRDDLANMNRKMNKFSLNSAHYTNEPYNAEIEHYITEFSFTKNFTISELSDFNSEPFLDMVESYISKHVPENIAIKPRHQNSIKNQFEAAISRIMENVKALQG